MSNIGDRLKELLQKKGLTPYKLSKRTGVSQSTLSRIIKNNSTPNESNLKVIVDFFNIDETWFLTGKNKESLTNTNGNRFIEKEDGSFNITVKLIPFDAYATYTESFDNPTVIEDFEDVTFNVDKYGLGNYKAFRVKGDSMNGGGINDTPDKAMVLARELGKHHWKDGFNASKYGWIILSEVNIFHKDIINSKNGSIICHSRNTSPEYSDFELKLNDIYQIFKVIKRTF